MKFDFRCQGHVIILIVRVSRLQPNERSDESNVFRLPSLVSLNFSFVKALYSYEQIISFYISAEGKELQLWMNFPRRFE